MKNILLITLESYMFANQVSAANLCTVIVKAPREHILPTIERNIFNKLRINVGTAKSVVLNPKARVPSYILKMDFSKPYLRHLLQTSAQLVDKYDCVPNQPKPCLLNRQLVAVTNFPKRHIGIPSYFLTLGVVGISEEEGGSVVLMPVKPVTNGARIVLLNENEVLDNEEHMDLVEFHDTFEKLDLRVGTVIDAKQRLIDFGELGDYRLIADDYELSDNMQIIRLMNLSGLDADNDNILGVIENNCKILLTVESRVPNGRFVL